jgi:RecJ-like exonuclease
MGRQKCPVCNGAGEEIISEKTCPKCKGIGSNKIVLSSSYSSSNNDNKCEKCGGSGVLRKTRKCTFCDGTGSIKSCDLCGEPIEKGNAVRRGNQDLCQKCVKEPMVYTLKPPCNSRIVEHGTYYHAKCKDFTKFGLFAELHPGIDGLIRNKNLRGLKRSDVGKEIIVKVINKTRDGKIELMPVNLKKYRNGIKREKMDRIKISNISRKMQNQTVLIQGKVSQIRQTTGPIAYNFSDESGSIAGAAFVKSKQENPYEDIEVDDIVEVYGSVSIHRDILQIEIEDMVEAGDDEAEEVRQRIEKVLKQKSQPEETDFLIDDPVLKNMKDDLYKLATIIRRAIFDGTPILIRHHADTDGITCAVALEQAILPILQREQPESIQYRLKRSPSKSPFWDFIDVTKDVDYALQDAVRFGDKLPLVLLLDLGSSHESLASIKKAKLFGLDVAVMDHHFPEEIIKENVLVHVNPYYKEGDYNLCAGMLGAELANIINPEISEEIIHLPAIAGIADHVEGKPLEKYMLLAQKKGLKKSFMEKIGLAIDYEQYFLRFADGKNIIDSLYGLDGLNKKNHHEVVELLAGEAQQAIDEQLAICREHLKSEELANKAILYTIDVERFARKFEFPPPGKTTGAIHDEMTDKNPDKGVVTLGVGPDFIVLRSKGVLMNFPKIIGNLKKKLPEAGADGGGHEVVGSVKFVEGMREEVLDFLKKSIGKAEVQL